MKRHWMLRLVLGTAVLAAVLAFSGGAAFADDDCIDDCREQFRDDIEDCREQLDNALEAVQERFEECLDNAQNPQDVRQCRRERTQSRFDAIREYVECLTVAAKTRNQCFKDCQASKIRP